MRNFLWHVHLRVKKETIAINVTKSERAHDGYQEKRKWFLCFLFAIFFASTRRKFMGQNLCDEKISLYL